jgi:hypothetical protein
MGSSHPSHPSGLRNNPGRRAVSGGQGSITAGRRSIDERLQAISAPRSTIVCPVGAACRGGTFRGVCGGHGERELR